MWDHLEEVPNHPFWGDLCRFKGGFVEDPLEDDFIDDFRQVHVPMVEKVQRSVEVPQVQHGSAVGVVFGRNHG